MNFGFWVFVNLGHFQSLFWGRDEFFISTIPAWAGWSYDAQGQSNRIDRVLEANGSVYFLLCKSDDRWPFLFFLICIWNSRRASDHTWFSMTTLNIRFFVCIRWEAWQRFLKCQKALERYIIISIDWTWTDVIVMSVLGDLVTFYSKLFYWIIKIEHFSIAIVFIHTSHHNSSPMIASIW